MQYASIQKSQFVATLVLYLYWGLKAWRLNGGGETDPFHSDIIQNGDISAIV